MDADTNSPSEISSIPENNPRSSSALAKSRKRVPSSCSMCRRRKIKCDKSRPFCSACIRSSACDACIYENQPWDVSTNLKRLNQQVIQLRQRNAEYKSIIDGYKAQLQQFIGHKYISDARETYSDLQSKSHLYPQPYISNSKIGKFGDEKNNDEIQDLIKDFDVLVIKQNKLLHFGSTSFMSLVNNDPIMSDVLNKFLLCQKEIYHRSNICDDNSTAVAGDAEYLSSKARASVSQIVNPINDLLPPKVAVDGLLKRFFQKCYYLLPYVDEQSFYRQVGRILKSNKDGYCFFEVPSTHYLPVVSLTLMFLRLAFLTIPVHYIKQQINLGNKNRLKVDDFAKDIVSMDVNISPIYIEHAKNCISNAAVLRKSNLLTIQTMLYLKLYRLQSPEDGDAGADSQVSLAMMITMAKSIGLHRDPNSFDVVADPNVKHLWRKIWYKLLELDAKCSLELGAQMLISDDSSYDTELPYITSSLQKTGTVSMVENDVITKIALEFQYVCLIRRINRIMTSVTENPKRSDINQCLEDLKRFKTEKVSSISTIKELAAPLSSKLDNLSCATRSKLSHELILQLHGEITQHILNYILVLTCQQNNNEVRDKYMRKSAVSALSAFKIVIEIFSNENYVFGHDLATFILPPVITLGQRVFQMICILVSRHSTDLGELLLDEELDDTGRDVKKWLFKTQKSVARLMGFNQDDKRLSSFSIYAYMEEFYFYMEQYSGVYYPAWKFANLIKLFIVYIIEKQPIYREFSNKRFASLKTEKEDAINKNPHHDAKQDFSGLVTSGTGEKDATLVDLDKYVENGLWSLDMYKEVKMDTHWADLLDESGQLKFDTFNPLFSDDMELLDKITEESNMFDFDKRNIGFPDDKFNNGPALEGVDLFESNTSPVYAFKDFEDPKSLGPSSNESSGVPLDGNNIIQGGFDNVIGNQNSSNGTSTSQGNNTSQGKTNEEETTPSTGVSPDEDYGYQLAKMMFG